MNEIKENVIEWVTGENYVSCTFTQRKYITKAKRLIVKIRALAPSFDARLTENEDGSIFCHLPLNTVILASFAGQRSAVFALDEGNEEDGSC